MGRRKTQVKFKLSELFGGEFPRDERLKLKIGHEIIEEIRKQARSGLDANGKKWVKPANKYSKEYINSVEFSAYGKKKSPVNMTLTGAMLDLMEIVKLKGSEVTIGWGDDDERAKAENHINGVTVPKRDFLGLPQKTLKKIADKNRGIVERAKQDALTRRDEDRLEAELEAEETGEF